MPRLLSIVIASWFMSSLVMAEPAATPQSTSAAMDEVRQSFTMDGKPIPPGIFRDLGDGDMADSISILVTVDLKAAVGSNRYYEDISRSGKWIVQKKANKDVANAEAKADEKTTDAAGDAVVTQAEGDHKVALAQCESLAGQAQKDCKKQADDQLDAVKAKVKQLKKDAG